nr:hypothetical protein [Desulfobacterales bacterium]
KHAPNRERRDAARSRLVGIRSQILVHKSQAALNRRTIESTKTALVFLKEATYLDLSAAEGELVKLRMTATEQVLADLEKAKAEAERRAAEEADLEAEARKLEKVSEHSEPVEPETH